MKAMKAKNQAAITEMIRGYELARALRQAQREQATQDPASHDDIVKIIREAYPTPCDQHRISHTEPVKCRPTNPGHSMFTANQLKVAIGKISVFAGPDLTGHRAEHWRPAFRGRREGDSWEN